LALSPKIGIVVDARPYLPASMRSIDRVRMAVNVVESQGKAIALDGEHGVDRHGMTGGWVANGRQHPRRVSLLGAICIVFQPPQALAVEEGAAEALEVSAAWVAGLADGFVGEVTVPHLTKLNRELYKVGLRAGHLLFAEVTVECPECGARRYRRDERCSVCR
jgi:hypothetical protein